MEMERDKNKQDRIRQTKKKIKSQKKAQETHTNTETHLCRQKATKARWEAITYRQRSRRLKKISRHCEDKITLKKISLSLFCVSHLLLRIGPALYCGLYSQ